MINTVKINEANFRIIVTTVTGFLRTNKGLKILNIKSSRLESNRLNRGRVKSKIKVEKKRVRDSRIDRNEKRRSAVMHGKRKGSRVLFTPQKGSYIYEIESLKRENFNLLEKLKLLDTEDLNMQNELKSQDRNNLNLQQISKSESLKKLELQYTQYHNLQDLLGVMSQEKEKLKSQTDENLRSQTKKKLNMLQREKLMSLYILRLLRNEKLKLQDIEKLELHKRKELKLLTKENLKLPDREILNMLDELKGKLKSQNNNKLKLVEIGILDSHQKLNLRSIEYHNLQDLSKEMSLEREKLKSLSNEKLKSLSNEKLKSLSNEKLNSLSNEKLKSLYILELLDNEKLKLQETEKLKLQETEVLKLLEIEKVKSQDKSKMRSNLEKEITNLHDKLKSNILEREKLLEREKSNTLEREKLNLQKRYNLQKIEKLNLHEIVEKQLILEKKMKFEFQKKKVSEEKKKMRVNLQKKRKKVVEKDKEKGVDLQEKRGLELRAKRIMTVLTQESMNISQMVNARNSKISSLVSLRERKILDKKEEIRKRSIQKKINSAKAIGMLKIYGNNSGSIVAVKAFDSHFDGNNLSKITDITPSKISFPALLKITLEDITRALGVSGSDYYDDNTRVKILKFSGIFKRLYGNAIFNSISQKGKDELIDSLYIHIFNSTNNPVYSDLIKWGGSPMKYSDKLRRVSIFINKVKIAHSRDHIREIVSDVDLLHKYNGIMSFKRQNPKMIPSKWNDVKMITDLIDAVDFVDQLIGKVKSLESYNNIVNGCYNDTPEWSAELVLSNIDPLYIMDTTRCEIRATPGKTPSPNTSTEIFAWGNSDTKTLVDFKLHQTPKSIMARNFNEFLIGQKFTSYPSNIQEELKKVINYRMSSNNGENDAFNYLINWKDNMSETVLIKKIREFIDDDTIPLKTIIGTKIFDTFNRYLILRHHALRVTSSKNSIKAGKIWNMYYSRPYLIVNIDFNPGLFFIRAICYKILYYEPYKYVLDNIFKSEISLELKVEEILHSHNIYHIINIGKYLTNSHKLILKKLVNFYGKISVKGIEKGSAYESEYGNIFSSSLMNELEWKKEWEKAVNLRDVKLKEKKLEKKKVREKKEVVEKKLEKKGKGKVKKKKVREKLNLHKKFESLDREKLDLRKEFQRKLNLLHIGKSDSLVPKDKPIMTDQTGLITQFLLNHSIADFGKNRTLIGLQNFGVTCYVNAALQLLINNSVFLKWLFVNLGSKLTANLVDWDILAHFLLSISIGVESKLKEFHDWMVSKEWIKEKVMSASFHVMYRIFGCLKPQMFEWTHSEGFECESCRKISHNEEEKNQKSFIYSIPGILSMVSGFENHEPKSKGKCKNLTCKNFDNYGNGKSKFTIHKVPEFPIISIGRGSNIKKKIIINENFSVEVDKKINVNLKLQALIIHSGGYRDGHYYAIYRHSDKWYLFNDKTVNLTDITPYLGKSNESSRSMIAMYSKS